MAPGRSGPRSGAGLDGAIETVVYGVMDHPSVGAAAVAAVAAERVGLGLAPVGARGLVAWDHPELVLSELHHRGVKVAAFTGPLHSSRR